MTKFSAPIAEQIWDKKYRFKNRDGSPIDVTLDDTLWRISNALAMAEEPNQRDEWASKFRQALEDFVYLPAGRITAGAGTGRSVTLSNCLAGDTLILTAEYGVVFISEIAGETVNVLDGNGNWVEAPINSFGLQKTAPVVLKGGYNGRERKVINATAKHRWILEDDFETETSLLEVGNKLKFVRREDVEHNPAYMAGVRHGIVYGDGSQRPEGEVKLRLCGQKKSLAGFFESWTVTSPDSSDGDQNVYLGRGQGQKLKLKSLPKIGSSVEYMTGFLRGWMATDGCVTRGKALISGGAHEAEWLRKFGPVAGMEVSCVTKLGDETNYGQRNKVIFNVHFHRWTMIEEDFILNAHRLKFEAARYPWIVESIGQFGAPEPVYCPRVLTTDSVQLDMGVHTGQCFTMGTIPDSMDGIFTHLKEAALTMQQGGGIGYDFSTLRPKGADVKGVAADASGPLTFMDVWDAMCRTVMSAGARRGAMMATMRCDHPDIEDFVTAKHDPLRLRNFNLSVLVTDAFMDAVKNDQPWTLQFNGEQYKTISALALWNTMMQSNYDSAEPGVIFIDRVNRDHNLNYIETVATTNPCGEKPMGPYASCLLGSINLARLVTKAFTPEASFDIPRLVEAVRIAIRMMDNVVDVGGFPLPAQKQKAKDDRQLGLGITGLADALAMVNFEYGTLDAASLTGTIMRKIALTAYEASIDLAQEKGCFPNFDADEYLGSESFASRMLPDYTQDRIREVGIRNSLLISIAPTGTISMYAGNVSSGIEPIFAFSYDRKILNEDGTKRIESVEDYAVAEYRKYWENNETICTNCDGGPGNEGACLCGKEAYLAFDESMLPSCFVSAQTITPEAHIRMQAAAQKWVDSSISKTTNVPEDISFEDFKGVYMLAWDSGCKGCTTYRPNAITGSILSVKEEPKPEAKNAGPIPHLFPGTEITFDESPQQRPAKLDGSVYKLKFGDMEHAVYVTLTDVEDAAGNRRPFEIFFNTKAVDHTAWMTTLSRTISAIFRRPHDSRFIVQELKDVHDPRGGAWHGGRYVPSIQAAIGGIIEEHMIAIGYIKAVSVVPTERLSETIGSLRATIKGKPCPKCGGYNFKHEAGCSTCLDCAWSKCS